MRINKLCNRYWENILRLKVILNFKDGLREDVDGSDGGEELADVHDADGEGVDACDGYDGSARNGDVSARHACGNGNP